MQILKLIFEPKITFFAENINYLNWFSSYMYFYNDLIDLKTLINANGPN